MNAIILLLVALMALFTNAHPHVGEREPHKEKEHSLAHGFPHVTGLRITEESIKRHKTEQYQPEMGFAVRRGMPFDLDVSVSKELANNEQILLQFDETETKVPHLTTKITGGPTKSRGESVYRLEVSSREDDPIGTWTDMIAVVASAKAEKAEKSLEGYVYAYPFEVKILDKEPSMFDKKKPYGEVTKDPAHEAVNTILDKVEALEQQYEEMLSELEKMDRGVVKAL